MFTILVSGSKGFVGTALCKSLKEKGFRLLSLVRKPGSSEDVLWDPQKKQIEKERLKNINAVIFLSGEPIIGRWTRSKKEKIYSSRINSSRFLIQALEESCPNLEVYISASAIGFYGDCQDREVTESHSRGEGFLAKVCEDWEMQAQTSKLLRTVFLRFGMILQKDGGALKKMLPSYLLGLGAKLGNGKQYVSWVSLEDVIAAVEFCIKNKNIKGAVNIVSDQPVRQKEFGKSLAKALHRPFWFHIPRRVLQMLFPYMASEVFLFSCRALPEKLLSFGYQFKHSNLDLFFKDQFKR